MDAAPHAPPHEPPHDPRSLQEVWDGHFVAFNAKDVDKIVQDYDDNSVFTVYNQATDTKNVYKGAEGARSVFTWFFGTVPDMADMVTLVSEVSEESKTGLFVWRGPGYPDGTDTFVFGENKKIYRQFAVIRSD